MGQDTESSDGRKAAEVVQTSSSGPSSGGLYASPTEALKSVSDYYVYWSGKLTETSLQMNYALIGANWAVFGAKSGLSGILGNQWARWSMLLTLAALLINLVAAFVLSQLLEHRIDYAEMDIPRWTQQYKESSGKKVAWPFTKSINGTGSVVRWLRTVLTITSGVLLMIAVYLK